MSPDATDERPVLRVVRGDPTPQELAALVAVLAASGGSGASSDRPSSVTRWGTTGSAVRPALAPGPDAWRTSAWPT